MSDDRFASIKRQLAELDAARRLSDDSPLRWLAEEVERLRSIVYSAPIDGMRLLAQCADCTTHVGLRHASESVLRWTPRAVEEFNRV